MRPPKLICRLSCKRKRLKVRATPVGASIRASTPKFGGFGQKPTRAGPLYGLSFSILFRILTPTLHFWRPSILPFKRGSHHFSFPPLCSSPSLLATRAH
jgi:hypothetical protein